MNDTITIKNTQDVPAPTLQQVYKYAEEHKLLIAFDEFDSVQETFNRVCRASICKTQREIYDEMVGTKGKIQFDCNTCHHMDTCADSKSVVGTMGMPPLSQRSAKPECWVCGHVWVKHNDFKYRECDVCHSVKQLNDDSVQIKHTRG